VQLRVCDDITHFAKTLRAASDISKVNFVTGRNKAGTPDYMPWHNTKRKGRSGGSAYEFATVDVFSGFHFCGI
jgi:hypothetical protein